MSTALEYLRALSLDASERSDPRSNNEIWFYMAEAVSTARPPDDVVRSLIATDAERQSKWSPKHAMKRPQGNRIRCIPCLKERNEWKTWLNRLGAISKELREHLEDEHAIKFGGEPDKPPSASSSSSSSLLPVGNPLAKAQRAAAVSQLKIKKNVRLDLNGQCWTQNAVVPPSPAVRLATQAAQAAQAASSSRPRAPKDIENLRTQLDELTAERDQIRIERDQIETERDQARIERDREMDMRRALESEAQRLKDAASAREEELLKVSRLMCTSLQALTGEADLTKPST